MYIRQFVEIFLLKTETLWERENYPKLVTWHRLPLQNQISYRANLYYL